MSKTRTSEWLKMLVKDCYERRNLPELQGVKGHQVRMHAVSWADMAAVDPRKICDAVTARSDCMFARLYSLDPADSVSSYFGRRILSSASSSNVASL